MSRIAVIGAGAWGTSLTVVLARNGVHQVRLWAFEDEVCRSVERCRENALFLPGVVIPASVHVTNSIAEALDQVSIVVGVMPSHHARNLYRQMKPHLRPEMLFISATKGLETGSRPRMSEVIDAVFARRASPDFVPGRVRFPARHSPSEVARVIPRRSPSRPTMTNWCTRCSANSAIPSSAFTGTMTLSGSSLAARSRTSSPSPPAWWKDSALATIPPPRSLPAGWRR